MGKNLGLVACLLLTIASSAAVDLPANRRLRSSINQVSGNYFVLKLGTLVLLRKLWHLCSIAVNALMVVKPLHHAEGGAVFFCLLTSCA